MATNKGHRIGEMLLDEEIITQTQLQECLQEQKVTGEKIGEVLVRKGYVALEVLMAFLGNQMGVPYVSLAEMQNVPQAILKLLPEPLMRTQHVIPISKKGNTLTLAMADPTNVFVTDDIKLSTRCDLELRLTSEKEVKAALDKYFGFKEEDTGELVKASSSDDTFGAAPSTLSVHPQPVSSPMGGGSMGGGSMGGGSMGGGSMGGGSMGSGSMAGSSRGSSMQMAASAAAAMSREPESESMAAIPTATAGSAGDTPVINFLTSVLVEASKVGASDIHFEPYEKQFRIRWRIDGILQEVQSPPRSLANALASRLKVMAEMNQQAKGIAQEGRLRLKIPGKEVSLSILIAPTMWGEKVVLHILGSEGGVPDLAKLGLEPIQLDALRRIVQQPHGLIMVIGPRGSGKTTMAYATLGYLNQPTKNVSAVDEVVDYSLAGINQVVVNEKRGMAYNTGVQAMLDQDADVLLVGKMNDLNVARLILDSVPSGRLIISTLASSDPVAAVQYFVNMGIEPYLVGSALTAIVNERLVRMICPQCKETYEASAEIAKYLGGEGGRKVMLSRGRGCDQCSQTGYRGRQAVFEVIPVKDALRELIINKAPAAVMKKTIAETPGFVSLKTLVAKKVLSGITSYDELLRVAS